MKAARARCRCSVPSQHHDSSQKYQPTTCFVFAVEKKNMCVQYVSYDKIQSTHACAVCAVCAVCALAPKRIQTAETYTLVTRALRTPNARLLSPLLHAPTRAGHNKKKGHLVDEDDPTAAAATYFLIIVQDKRVQPRIGTSQGHNGNINQSPRETVTECRLRREKVWYRTTYSIHK